MFPLVLWTKWMWRGRAAVRGLLAGSGVPFILTPCVVLASLTPGLNYRALGLLSNGSYLSY